MTKPWKLKTNSSNILLVLITLMLVRRADWVAGKTFPPSQVHQVGLLSNNLYDPDDQQEKVERIIVGNDEISRYYFRSSSANASLTLDNVNHCLENFQLVTCLKLLLLDRINVAVDVLREPEAAKTDFVFLGGLISFGRKRLESAETFDESSSERSEVLTLDEEISQGVLKLFRNRSLKVNLSPYHSVDVAPIQGNKKDGFLCFGYKFSRKEEGTGIGRSRYGEARKKRKKGGMNFMMIPQLIMLGFLPFTLASIKAMVMNAVMVNMMALNGAIFMTIRNLVFGPRAGENVQYVNYGYSKDRQTQKKRPVLIIHSPAAFIKRPIHHQTYRVPHKPPHPHYIQKKEFHSQDHRNALEWEGDQDKSNNYSNMDTRYMNEEAEEEEEFYGGRTAEDTEQVTAGNRRSTYRRRPSHGTWNQR